jgi:hypothetical protein
LQELADTELRLGFHDSPTYGRRYEIYHNQVRAGSLELQTSYAAGIFGSGTLSGWTVVKEGEEVCSDPEANTAAKEIECE